MKTIYETGTIDELCHVEYGTRVVRKRDAGSTYPVYGGGGETFYLDSFNRENRVVIARFAMSEKCTRKVLGKFALNDSGLTLSPKKVETLRQDYLDYWTLSLNYVIYEKARGTAQKNLDMPTFRKIQLTFPSSIEIQKLIVEKLDNAFAEINSLEKNLQLKEEKTNQLLQSMLSAAFTNSEEFDVELVKLGEICEFNPPKKQVREKLKSSDLVSFLPMHDLPIRTKDCSTEATKQLEEVIKQYTFFANDDLLIAKITPCFENGKMSIARNLKNGFGFGSSEYIVIRTQQNVLVEYVYYFLSQDLTINVGRDLMTGAVGHKRIPVEYFQEFLIPLPNLDVQRILINRLDIAFAEIDKLKNQITIEKERISSLRQSILSDAFNFKEQAA
jgi:type I restriction enzyme S subunit